MIKIYLDDTLKTIMYWLLAQIMFGSWGVCLTWPDTQGFTPWVGLKSTKASKLNLSLSLIFLMLSTDLPWKYILRRRSQASQAPAWSAPRWRRWSRWQYSRQGACQPWGPRTHPPGAGGSPSRCQEPQPSVSWCTCKKRLADFHYGRKRKVAKCFQLLHLGFASTHLPVFPVKLVHLHKLDHYSSPQWRKRKG